MSNNYYHDKEGLESLNDYKYLFSNYEKNIPTFNEALYQMFKYEGLDDANINFLINDILTKCKNAINSRFNLIKQKYKNISINDAYIICSYTFDSIKEMYSPYRLLNKNLNYRERKYGIKKISKYLYIFLKSLRKLDRFYPTQANNYLYRCIFNQVILEKDPFNDKLIPYIKGYQKTLWGFTSTSTNPKSAIYFLGRKEQFKSGTIFLLTGDVWGYDITLFNYYNEEEIILEPETKYIIDSILPPVNEVIYIICKVLKSSLVLESNKIEPTYSKDSKNIINNDAKKYERSKEYFNNNITK